MPTIETVLERLQDFRTNFDAFRAEMTVFRTDTENRLSKIEFEMRMTNHKLENIVQDIANIRAQNRDFDQRLSRLEVGPNSPTEQLTR